VAQLFSLGIIRALKNMNTKSIAAAFLAAISIFGIGAAKRADGLASATISWIHPRLPQPTTPVAITNSATLALLPTLFPGYDGPPPDAPPHEPPMYDCVFVLTKPDGTHADIKVYLPRLDFGFPGMWRHPKGQLIYFGDDEGKQVLQVVAPYIPKGFHP